VADFRDPWRDSPFRESTFAMLERWDDWLEQKVLRRASHVVCNTPTMAERLCKRLPFVADKCSTILNGFDAERPYAAESWRTAPSETFVLTHAGQFYGPRSPKPVFKALRSLLKRRPALRGKLQLLLIGPRLFDGTDLAQMAKEAGVDEHVHVLGQKSHAETMSRLAGSDALLLAGTSGVGSELQVPNKLFEYLTLRKPIIATLASGNPAIDILKDARAEALVCDPNDTVALASAITQLATGKHPDVADAWSGVAQFDRTHRAEELADVFRMVSENESHRTAQTTLPSPLRTQSQLLEHA
jgi:glycosyltransferase involved in cell wall biosynthesis